MLPYLLVTITILIVVICITMFYGYRQLNQLSMNVQRHNNDIAALKHILEDGIQHLQGPPMPRHMAMEGEFPFPQDDNYMIDEQDDDEPPIDDQSDGEEMPDDKVEQQDGGEESNKESSDISENQLSDLENVLDAIEETHEEAQTTNEEVGGDKFIDLTPNSKASAKKVPDEAAKNYEDGFKMLSTNDNNYYTVISTKSGGKRWKKTSE